MTRLLMFCAAFFLGSLCGRLAADDDDIFGNFMIGLVVLIGAIAASVLLIRGASL